MKETLVLGLQDIPNPYKGWVEQRNRTIGEMIAGMQDSGRVSQGTIVVATRPVLAHEVPIDADTFYGTVVKDLRDVEKTVFHPHGSFSAGSFQERVSRQGLVLPGIAVHTKDEFEKGIDTLREKIGRKSTLRAKVPHESDGNGQYRFSKKRKGKKIAKHLEAILEDGIVLEAQLANPKTISVGFAKIGTETYSFIAEQHNETVVEYDSNMNKKVKKNRYKGAHLNVIRGEMQQLLDLDDLTPEMKKAVDTSVAFHEDYVNAFGIDTKRISYDYMYGKRQKRHNKTGEMLSGISDITARPGGSDPALFVAAQELHNNPSYSSVSAEVLLDFSLDHTFPPHTVFFVDDPALRIGAYITKRTGDISLKERRVS